MSLFSTFYVGPAAEVARAIRDRPATVTKEFPSCDLSVGLLDPEGLTMDEIEAACDALREVSGAHDPAISVAAGDILHADGDERQVIRITPAFVGAFAALTDVETEELSRRLGQRESEDAREFAERRGQMASRPIQSPLDYLALAIVPAFTWLESRNVLVTLAVTGAFVLLTVAVLPRWRRRRIARPRRAPRDFRPALHRIAEICQTAVRTRQELVYEWSL